MRHLIRSLALLCVLAVALGATSVDAKVFKIATVAPEGSNWMREMRAGAANVKQRTAGRVEFKFYPGGVMGNDSAVLRKIKLGQLQGGAFSGAELSPVNPDAQVYSLPFLFRSQAEVDYVRPKVDPLIKAGFEKNGMVALGLTGGGFAYLLSTKPIRTREDLKASKVWAPSNDVIAQVAFRAGGVEPVTLPIADVYPALSTGLIETVGNTPAGVIVFQWHTKLRFMVDLPLTYVMGIFAVDKKAYDDVSVEDRKVMHEEIAAAFQRLEAINRRDDESARAALAKQGITLFKPSDDEAKFWNEVGVKAREQLSAQHAYSADVFAAVQAAIEEYRRSGGAAGGATP
jgi:TRAP-type C4-dicarboxylate transport system substrate-binding protein